jgi:hypothetical protein
MMNKVLGRALFSRARKPQKAHGTGITKLVVGEEKGYFNGGEVTAPTPTPASAPVAGVPALGEQYAKMFQAFAGPQRSYEQILAERQKALGEGDMGLQTALAIMALGGRIASTPGGLLSAIGSNLPEFSSTVGKAASEQEKQRAALRVGAMEAVERDRAQRSALGLEGLKTAISQAFSEGQAAKTREFQTRENVLTREFQMQQAKDQRAFTEAQTTAEREYRTGERTAGEDFKLLTQDPQPFIQVDPVNPEKYKFLGTFKLNRQGKYVDENGREKPADALPFNERTAKIFTPDFGEPKMAYVPDLNNPIGLREVMVQTDKKNDRLVLLNPDGTRSSAPAGTILRGQNEVFSLKAEGDTISRTIKEGPFAGITVVTDRAGKIQNPEVYSSMGIDPKNIRGFTAPTGAPTVPAAPAAVAPAPAPAAPVPTAPMAPAAPATVAPTAPTPAATDPAVLGTTTPERAQARDQAIDLKAQARGNRPAAVGDITGQGAQRFIVEAQPPSSQRAFELTPRQREDISKKIVQGENVLATLNSATQGAYEAVGLGPKLKSILTNVFDPVIPGVDLAFTENEAKKTELRNLGRQIIQAFAQNADRVSVYEQQILDRLGPDPDKWFANPSTALAQVKELYRLVANDVERQKAVLENRPPLEMKRIPPGTESEPLTSEFIPYINEMSKQGHGDLFIGKVVKFPDGRTVRLGGKP